MDRELMTVEGEIVLRDELKKLKTVDRPSITQAIADARADGDLKENADYQAAREQQSFCEGRIADIESKLGRSQVIDITTIEPSERVIFGSTVTLINLETEESFCYKIVGTDEADIKHMKVSYTSPIAKAMIGRSEGDEIQVKTPSGPVEYEITQVEYR